MSGANVFGFDLFGLIGQRVVVEGSSDLLQWVPVATNSFVNGPIHFEDAVNPPAAQRFYRVRLAP